MSEIVPYVSAEAKRAAEQTRKLMQDQQGSGDAIAAITNLLDAMEGMQTQIDAMTAIICEQDKRIEKLERRKIIRGVGS